jgi:hypothetical protein
MFLNLVISPVFPPPCSLRLQTSYEAKNPGLAIKTTCMVGSEDHESGGEDFALQDEKTVSGVRRSTTVAMVTKIEEVFQSRAMSAIFYSFSI